MKIINYNSEFGNPISRTQREKKKSAAGCQVISLKFLQFSLLHNRIRMLKMEEEKAMKKIQETRRKAQQIMDLKKESMLNSGPFINNFP